MKKIICICCSIALLYSCNNNNKPAEVTTDTTAAKVSMDLPFTATYSSSFNSEVSDKDLKSVLGMYKNWADGNMDGLMGAFADSIQYETADGDSGKTSNADLKKKWGQYRDSITGIKYEMEAWHKMHSIDKKDDYIVVWYKEWDTFKNGNVDSSYLHDVNQLKDGKVTWYSQYKRPMKKK